MCATWPMASSMSDATWSSCKGVEALAPVTLGDHQPVLAQYAQLVGDRRLLHAEGLHQLSDRVRCGPQQAEDPYPARCGEGEHGVGDDAAAAAESRPAALAEPRLTSDPSLA